MLHRMQVDVSTSCRCITCSGAGSGRFRDGFGLDVRETETDDTLRSTKAFSMNMNLTLSLFLDQFRFRLHYLGIFCSRFPFLLLFHDSIELWRTSSSSFICFSKNQYPVRRSSSFFEGRVLLFFPNISQSHGHDLHMIKFKHNRIYSM